MLIDRTHRSWALAAVAVFIAALVLYVWSAAASRQPPGGGSPVGLLFGIGGFALMVFAALLSARRNVPTWRIGRLQTWMRGHLWLGLLSVPLILFHSGLSLGGGALTRMLMALLAIVTVSGIAGAAAQHFLPRLMFDQVPMETIFEQIPHVRQHLVEEADTLVGAVFGIKPPPAHESSSHERSAEMLAAISRVDGGQLAPLRDFFLADVRPFLAQPSSSYKIADARAALREFNRLRTLLPEAVRPTLDDLDNIGEEARQLVRQSRLHWYLHGWVLVHAPLSFALLVLTLAHIVMALRY